MNDFGTIIALYFLPALLYKNAMTLALALVSNPNVNTQAMFADLVQPTIIPAASFTFRSVKLELANSP